jgi:signal transduction histidine kinase
LREAIENLLDNAFKYAPHSDVALRVGAEENEIAVAVEDEGPGIEPAERERIFDRFYRGTANDSDVEGSGLGLAIVKRAVERAQGAIELESDIPGGSCFTIRLPRAY